MHRRALTCRLCQQQFFPASLKFHVKVCAKRQEHVELPCDHCNERVLCTMLKVHMKFCEQRNSRARTTGNTRLRSPDSMETRRQGGVGGPGTSEAPSSMASSGADQQQQPLTTPQSAREHAQDPPLQHAQSHDVIHSSPRRGLRDNSDSICPSDRLGGGRGHDENGDGNNVVVTANDGRIACTNCQRWFSSDRVGVHQDICGRVNPPSASAPGARERGKDKPAESKKARSRLSSSRPESRWRKSSRPAVGEIHAAARARGARRRSVRGKKRLINGRRAIEDASRDKTCFGSDDQMWRESAPTHAQADTAATAREPTPAIPSSAGAEYRGTSFSSILGPEGSSSPNDEKQPQQREIHGHRRRGTPHWKESWDNHHRARRPSSATGLVSISENKVPLAPVEGSRKRVSVGRAVSTSCSPVRLRRGSVSTAAAFTTEARSGRNEGDARRSSVVSTGGGRFGGGGGSEAELARSSNTARRGAAARGVGSERLSGGMGFFSPSRDGGRIRLLK